MNRPAAADSSIGFGMLESMRVPAFLAARSGRASTRVQGSLGSSVIFVKISIRSGTLVAFVLVPDVSAMTSQPILSN